MDHRVIRMLTLKLAQGVDLLSSITRFAARIPRSKNIGLGRVRRALQNTSKNF